MAQGIKTGGRTKGTPNRMTQEVRATLQEIMDNELMEIPTLLATLEPKDRLSFIIKLLPYLIPKIKPDIPGLGNQKIVINFGDGDKEIEENGEKTAIKRQSLE